MSLFGFRPSATIPASPSPVSRPGGAGARARTHGRLRLGRCTRFCTRRSGARAVGWASWASVALVGQRLVCARAEGAESAAESIDHVCFAHIVAAVSLRRKLCLREFPAQRVSHMQPFSSLAPGRSGLRARSLRAGAGDQRVRGALPHPPVGRCGRAVADAGRGGGRHPRMPTCCQTKLRGAIGREPGTTDVVFTCHLNLIFAFAYLDAMRSKWRSQRRAPLVLLAAAQSRATLL